MFGRQPNWNGNIDTARESQKESPVENPNDGTREYSNGTYGQSDYTVRSRADGNLNLFITSDSDRLHDHWVIDEDGNIVEKYHDFVIYQNTNVSFNEIMNLSADMFLYLLKESLLNESRPQRLARRKK